MTSVLPPFPIPTPSSPVREHGSGGLPNLPVTSAGVPTFTSRNLEVPAMDLSTRPRAEPPAPEPPLPALEAAKAGDFTDADLAEALVPLLGSAVSHGDLRDDPAFEALLRATFRRALAEQSGSPFEDPNFAHRALWRLQALFTSRSYEEVLADKIRRFQVEEVYLLDRDRLSLVSYASCDPVRHSNARKVGAFVRQLGNRIKDESGALQLGFDLSERRRTFVRPGIFCHLVAVVRGEINDQLKSDLDFALRRIESRYRAPFEHGQPLLRELQPLLEECLLIHSPASPGGS
ncbi:hypothetical protein [Luteolibacter marinus]|uniref:hypothetical protein n=1 Tax=Luteolibacter marinus TaxID=2776705 RepID=UPI0018685DEF|nr:hypothetical protein [Luteolibacter marinus]